MQKRYCVFRVCYTALLIGLLTIVFTPRDADIREKSGNIWYFGDGAGLDFNTGITPTVLTDGVSLSSGGSAVISDPEGKLLLYTDGAQVWNAHHERMPNGHELMGSSIADQPAMLVPNPGNPNFYYIFTVSARLGLYYSTVNLALDEGSGEVTEKNIRLWPAAAGKITAVKHKNATDIWVIVPCTKDNTFYAYLVTASGVSSAPVVSQTGLGYSKCEFDLSGYLKASPDGRKLALSVFEPGFFELFDFDAATGTVSNPQFLGEYEAAYGIEFSPDSSKLYATVVSWAHKKIYQFDIPAGAPFGTLMVDVTDDSLNEQDETFSVALSNPVHATIADDDGVGTIRDNDPPPAVSINDVTVDEDVGTMTFTISLSAVSGQDVSVNYATQDDTALAGRDYAAASDTLTIPPGKVAVPLAVTIVDDSHDGYDGTLTVQLSTPLNATLVDDQGLGTIRDDDPPPAISINDVTVDEGAGKMIFRVSLSGTSSSHISFSYLTADGSATIADNDYLLLPETSRTIPAGETSSVITVNINEDTLIEGAETFYVVLDRPMNATIADGEGRGTISDNDALPTVSIDDVTRDEHAGTMTFTVTLSEVSTLPVIVGYTTQDGTASGGSDYVPASGTMEIVPDSLSGTIVVSIIDDAVAEEEEVFILRLHNVYHATLVDNRGVGTITDNER